MIGFLVLPCAVPWLTAPYVYLAVSHPQVVPWFYLNPPSTYELQRSSRHHLYEHVYFICTDLLGMLQHSGPWSGAQYQDPHELVFLLAGLIEIQRINTVLHNRLVSDHGRAVNHNSSHNNHENNKSSSNNDHNNTNNDHTNATDHSNGCNSNQTPSASVIDLTVDEDVVIELD